VTGQARTHVCVENSKSTWFFLRPLTFSDGVVRIYFFIEQDVLNWEGWAPVRHTNATSCLPFKFAWQPYAAIIEAVYSTFNAAMLCSSHPLVAFRLHVSYTSVDHSYSSASRFVANQSAERRIVYSGKDSNAEAFVASSRVSLNRPNVKSWRCLLANT
jgi:hypothetical protein